jgi:hypothetical protein
VTFVAIHQPNHLPWLGFFQKIAVADIFVFLDDVQFSKNSYIDRGQVLHNDQSRWQTQPVRYNIGDTLKPYPWCHRIGSTVISTAKGFSS